MSNVFKNIYVKFPNSSRPNNRDLKKKVSKLSLLPKSECIVHKEYNPMCIIFKIKHTKFPNSIYPNDRDLLLKSLPYDRNYRDLRIYMV